MRNLALGILSLELAVADSALRLIRPQMTLNNGPARPPASPLAPGVGRIEESRSQTCSGGQACAGCEVRGGRCGLMRRDSSASSIDPPAYCWSNPNAERPGAGLVDRRHCGRALRRPSNRKSDHQRMRGFGRPGLEPPRPPIGRSSTSRNSRLALKSRKLGRCRRDRPLAAPRSGCGLPRACGISIGCAGLIVRNRVPSIGQAGRPGMYWVVAAVDVNDPIGRHHAVHDQGR
jgi:hypothetical protein